LDLSKRCSECDEPVVAEDDGEPVTLLCDVCLVRDSPPYESPVFHISPDHCSECFSG
jgi:hypothetical protein